MIPFDYFPILDCYRNHGIIRLPIRSSQPKQSASEHYTMLTVLRSQNRCPGFSSCCRPYKQSACPSSLLRLLRIEPIWKRPVLTYGKRIRSTFPWSTRGRCHKVYVSFDSMLCIENRCRESRQVPRSSTREFDPFIAQFQVWFATIIAGSPM